MRRPLYQIGGVLLVAGITLPEFETLLDSLKGWIPALRKYINDVTSTSSEKGVAAYSHPNCPSRCFLLLTYWKTRRTLDHFPFYCRDESSVTQ